jgi:hypothetical protein
MIMEWTSRKQRHWQSICGKMQAKGFLKKPSAYKARELLNLRRNQLRILKELLTGYSFIRSPIYTGTGKQSQV